MRICVRRHSLTPIIPWRAHAVRARHDVLALPTLTVLPSHEYSPDTLRFVRAHRLSLHTEALPALPARPMLPDAPGTPTCARHSVRTCVCTHVPAHVDVCDHSVTHACAHTHRHRHIHAHTHARAHVCGCARTYSHAHVHPCARLCAHTEAHGRVRRLRIVRRCWIYIIGLVRCMCNVWQCGNSRFRVVQCAGPRPYNPPARAHLSNGNRPPCLPPALARRCM